VGAGSLCAQVSDVSSQTATPIPGVGHHYLEFNYDLVQETVNPGTGSVSVSLPIQLPPSRD
jgi:hypothetical protein